MKFYILLAFIASAIIPGKAGMTPEEQKMLEEISHKCITESGVDAGVVSDAKNGNFADDPKLKDYALCFAKSVGFINDAGDLMMDHIKNVFYAHLDKDVADTILSKCMEKKATPQDTAFEIGKCMHPYKEH